MVLVQMSFMLMQEKKPHFNAANKLASSLVPA